MKKINILVTPGPKLSNVDFYQFITSQANHIKSLGDTMLTDAELRNLVITILSFAEDFNKAILQVQKNLKSDDIATKNQVRDISISALKSWVKNATYSTDEAELRAANGLTTLLDTYGDIARMSLDKESGTIDKLVAEFEGPTYKPMVEKIGLSARLARLKADNNAFKALYEGRRAESITKDSAKAISLRRQVNEQYQILSSYVLLRAKMTDDAQYAEALQIINTIRKEYNELVARHKAALKAAEEKKKAEEKQKEEEQKKTKKS
ncbi:DUF6261 family protein [uncultured Acetobacteroides sp.]|uniref:DUF6261 family protein n=1 Tax=uncultured Acetobacteroides sp. TaxID=1760811 RepID=UPI0029F54919|nr:DUF6261 family protein [uncultured Acetobacteroides sp.]